MNNMRFYVIPNLLELNKYLDLSKKYDFGFEYNEFFNPTLLDSNDLDKVINKYKSLNRKNDTMHGVFYDITLNSTDKLIKEISYKRVESSFKIAKELNVKGLVFHTNYITWMKDEVYINNWIEENKKAYLELVNKYDMDIYIENMFDLEPYILKRLLDSCNNKKINCCLDIAHASLSNVKLDVWFSVLGKYIKHIHINDNDLIKDSHEEIGKGKIDYKHAISLINQLNNKDELSILIEINDYDKALNSYKYLLGEISHENK